MTQYGNRDLGEEYQQGIFDMLKGVKDLWLESGMGLLNPNNPVHEYFREPVDPNTPPAGLLDTPSFKKMSETLPLLDPSSVGGIVKGFHASPHLFKKWDFGKNRSGEGGAAYGSGAYVAESKSVGESYADQFGKKGLGSHLYEVEVKPNPDDFIQWELQFEDQPEKIRKKLIEVGKKGYLPYKFDEGVQEFTQRVDTWEGLPKTETRKLNPDKKFGQEIYFDLVDSIQKKTGMGTHASAAEASRILSGEGIPGMRYKDQGTVQGYGQRRSHNYVVYPTQDPEMIKIMNPPSLID